MFHITLWDVITYIYWITDKHLLHITLWDEFTYLYWVTDIWLFHITIWDHFISWKNDSYSPRYDSLKTHRKILHRNCCHGKITQRHEQIDEWPFVSGVLCLLRMSMRQSLSKFSRNPALYAYRYQGHYTYNTKDILVWWAQINDRQWYLTPRWKESIFMDYITKEVFGVACSWQKKRVTSGAYPITAISACSAVARAGPQSIKPNSQEFPTIGNVSPITLSDSPGLGRLAGCCTFLFDRVNCLRLSRVHDDVITWKYFPRNWPFVRGIHPSPVNFRTKASDAELWCFLWYASE